MMTPAEERKLKTAIRTAETAITLAEKYRRELLVLGLTTDSRRTYDEVCHFFKAKNADELLALGRKAQVTP